MAPHLARERQDIRKQAVGHELLACRIWMDAIRLVELCVLEKRKFTIGDTNALMQFMRNFGAGVSSDVLWRISSKTGAVEIVAKPAEMPRWDAAIKPYADVADAGTLPNSPIRRFSPVAR